MRGVRVPARTGVLLAVAAAVLPCAQTAPTQLTSPEAHEHFLETARIVGREAVQEGSTHSFRITLTDGHTTHDAHVQTIDIFRPVFRAKDFVEYNFRDSYKFNIAAYRVAKMLKLDNVPVCVYREVDGQPASVDWWVDNVQFDELTRRDRKIEPPDAESWARQLNLVRAFDQLIDNVDRNQGNLLIDRNWKVWMIDHSRSFRVTTVLRRPDALNRVSLEMMNGLRSLNLAECNAQLKPYLTDDEIRTMLVRRDLEVKLFETAVSEKGPDAVYTDIPRHTQYATIP